MYVLICSDLVEELNPYIHEALGESVSVVMDPVADLIAWKQLWIMWEFAPSLLQKNVKKKKQRDQLRVQITRVFALTAEHGCFRQSPMTRTDKGEVSPIFLEFIEGIRYMYMY